MAMSTDSTETETFDWECQGPTVCDYVFNFDPLKLANTIQKLAKQQEQYQKGMKLMGIGSALRGDFTTATLGMGFAHETGLHGIKCPQCGWVNPWYDIAKALVDKVNAEARAREAEMRAVEAEKRASDEAEERLLADDRRLMDEMIRRFGHKNWKDKKIATRTIVSMTDNEFKVLRTWVRVDDDRIWYCSDFSNRTAARAARFGKP